jgi:3,4-dihydroxy 2-butanone 4-phosphate synthase/GTP cyclohydrolase II
MSTDMTRVADAIRAFERGEIVVVTDDNDRENEGDLVLAAVHATTEKLAFIVRHTCGIVCAPMTGENARRLNLDPMVATNDAPHSTAFTVSIDYRHGLTTGISAQERCNSVRGLANPNSGAVDFVRPGHVFPLVAKEGGVLMRSGHTEAAVDLCRLADLTPVGVICELVNDDGTVSRGDQVENFAQTHDLALVSVADLIAWRQRQERLIERVDEHTIQTSVGAAQAIAYRTPFDPMDHLAVVIGDILDGNDILVRLHLESVIDDVFGGVPALEPVLNRIAKEGAGIVVYLREGAVGVARSANRSRDGIPGEVEHHDSARAREEHWREIGIGAQILKDLGVTSIRLLSSRERHYVGLEGFGINITSTEIMDG